MKTAVIYRGLCENCDNAPNCTFPRDPARPVQFCDEFCWHPRCSAPRAQAIEPRFTAEQTIAAAQEYKGLCKICDHKADCTFPRSKERIVWCCEECC